MAKPAYQIVAAVLTKRLREGVTRDCGCYRKRQEAAAMMRAADSAWKRNMTPFHETLGKIRDMDLDKHRADIVCRRCGARTEW